MAIRIDAIYEHGVLRPLAPLELEEHQRVELAVNEKSPDVLSADEIFPAYSRENGHPGMTRADLRRALAAMPTRLSDAVDQGREERL